MCPVAQNKTILGLSGPNYTQHDITWLIKKILLFAKTKALFESSYIARFGQRPKGQTGSWSLDLSYESMMHTTMSLSHCERALALQ